MGSGSETLHRYRAHGLAIRSRIALPELIADHAGVHPDVEVTLGKVPTALPDLLFDGAYAQAAQGSFLLRIPEVAGYHLAAPSRVMVEPCPEAAPEDVRTFLLSSVMGALVHAHGHLPLQASAVRVGDGCLLLLGASGAGKSTLAAELVRRGLDLVSDDLTAISVGRDGEPRAHSGYRALRLWNDSLQRLKELEGIPAEIHPGRTGHGRRTAVVAGVGTSTPLPVRSIFLLGLQRDGPVAVRSLRGAAKIHALLEQTYRLHLLTALGSPIRHYQACLALAQRAPAYQLDRPADRDTLADLAREIAAREEIPGDVEVRT